MSQDEAFGLLNVKLDTIIQELNKKRCSAGSVATLKGQKLMDEMLWNSLELPNSGSIRPWAPSCCGTY